MKFKRWIIILLAASLIGFVAANDNLLVHLQTLFGANGSPSPTTINATGTIEVAFSPNNGATKTIVKAINEAKETIIVSAYSFTSKEIAEALLAAKNRGVQIKLILDRSQVSQKYSSSTFFTNQGFDLRIDIKHAIYHDKVMVIDEKNVITGSFNFTKAAENKNAENVLVFRNNPELAKLYAQDWWFNWYQAVPRSEFINKAKSKNRNTDDE